MRIAHRLTIGLLMAWALAACSPTRRLPQDAHLLIRNKLDAAGSKGALELEPDALMSIVKQKPNKRVLGYRFYLQAYNIPDPAKVGPRQERKNARTDQRNAKRTAKGKEPVPYGRCTDNWLREVVGEAPVILDTLLTRKSAEQIRLQLQKEGYFSAEVLDTTIYRGRKATVRYRLFPGVPHRLRNITVRVNDPTIQDYLDRVQDQSVLKPGDRFSAERLNKERERVTERLRELGYLFITRDMVRFDADTTVGKRQVDLIVLVERSLTRDGGVLTGTPEATFFHLDRVRLNIIPIDERTSGMDPDTLVHDGYEIIYRGLKPPYKPNALTNTVFLKAGDRYQQSLNDRTYRRLTTLRVFDRVDIRYDTLRTNAKDRVNCTIDLLPSKTQSTAAELYMTNRGGFLGTSTSLSYRHRNLLRGMGSIQASLTLGLEAQQSFTGSTMGTDNVIPLTGTQRLFNTVTIGPEVTIAFPSFLLPGKFAKSTSPRTTINLLYNYQRRPDFTRTLAKVSFGWEFNETRYKRHGIFPMEVNLVKIPFLTPEFQQFLRDSNNPVLTDSYTDHFILGMRYTFTYNTQDARPKRNSYFNQLTVTSSGNLTNAIDRLVDAPMSTDTAGNSFYTLAGIRYAQFVKVYDEFAYRLRFDEARTLAFRGAAGVGVPYGNLGVLPFETSFFVGGANGLRAWRARTIGPGSFFAPLLAFDRIGEVKLEGNVEYRFKLFSYFEAALFADVGNIWLVEEDPLQPGSGFAWDFISELAVGTGLGLRLNFDFFLIRFDLGLQTKDPSMPRGERWLFQSKERFEEQFLERYGYAANYKPQVILNLGIGYPF
ncbi:MAG: BamA/TamA family outer membrane protein [Flavobacteriales bacterium]|nr:BamA/TamA family outer membrane protein [Flavobacteriales bacterium]